MYKKVMVPLDGSALAECVLPHLQTVVKGCEGQPEVILVRAAEPISIPVGRGASQLSNIDQLKSFESHQRTEAESYLREKVAFLQTAGIISRAEVLSGKAGPALSDFANRQSVDLIIIASHGRSGVGHLIWGSVAEYILRTSHAAILMVRAATAAPGA
jgi:nucleotide-binding universal stress UspA family protein